jgi:hypothetical protein
VAKFIFVSGLSRCQPLGSMRLFIFILLAARVLQKHIYQTAEETKSGSFLPTRSARSTLSARTGFSCIPCAHSRFDSPRHKKLL